MDSYGFIDSIQAEKANALARYRQFNNISKILRLIEVFIGVVLISWSSTRLPTVIKVSGEYLYACSSYVLNQHVVFLVGNMIVVLCYALSGQTDTGNETASSDIIENNQYRLTDHHTTSEAVLNIESVRTPVEELPEAKQMDNAVRNENENLKTESEMEAEMVIKLAPKQIERFKKSQSVKLRREISMKPRGELRRSVTDRRRSVVTANDGDLAPSSFDSVERLSNVDFRLAVESFILKQQSFLKQQTLVEESYYL